MWDIVNNEVYDIRSSDEVYICKVNHEYYTHCLYRTNVRYIEVMSDSKINSLHYIDRIMRGIPGQ